MMDSKFLYFTKRTYFDNLVDSFPANLSPICFIEDTNEIWFNNHFFQAGHDTLRVSEMDNTVTVSLSDTNFRIVPGSASIGVRSSGNDIIISCNALTKIDTEGPLEWKNNKLFHKDAGVQAGSYGQKAAQTGASTVTIPRITFDQYGHATSAEDKEVKLRDYVEQRKADSQNQDRQILLSERDTDDDDTNITRKAKNFTYNNSSGKLKVDNIEIAGTQESSLVIKNGDLVVSKGTIIGKLQGEVTGTATPKIHLSENADYGGASKELYGHVKLVDTMPETPEPSSDNTDKNNTTVPGLAASPYLVFNYVKASKIKVNAIDAQKRIVDLSDRLDFTDDFVVSQNKLSISWLEL